MAAITAVMDLFTAGDHIIITDDVYGGTYRFMTQVLEKRKISVTFVDTSIVEQVNQAIRVETKAVFIETPTNPLLKVTDLKKVAALSREHDLLLIVDNTFSTPYWQTPIVLEIGRASCRERE